MQVQLYADGTRTSDSPAEMTTFLMDASMTLVSSPAFWSSDDKVSPKENKPAPASASMLVFAPSLRHQRNPIQASALRDVDHFGNVVEM